MGDSVTDDMGEAWAVAITFEEREAALGSANSEVPAILEHEPDIAGRLWAEVSSLDDQARGKSAGNEGLAEVREIIL